VTSPTTQLGRVEAIDAHLRRAGRLRGDERVVAVSQMSGGWSRHSFVAGVAGPAGEVSREYVVRVEAPGGVLETDVATEYAVFAALEGQPVSTPRVFGLEPAADNPFEGPFFVMEKVGGHAPNVFRSADREELAESWRGDRAIARDMVENLAGLHQLELSSVPPSVPRLEYAEVIARWHDVYRRYRLVRDPVIEEAFRWLEGREPAHPRVGLVHGDYRIGNALVAGGRVTAMLDWELAYVGDVRYDLGYLALERLAGKHLRPVTSLFGAFAERDWFFSEYERLTGSAVDPEDVRTFSVVGIMMLLGTINMGTAMYARRETSDFRLAWARFGTPGLRQDLTTLMGW
jgi:aminoglycoside phosphotransferase (APT) family kinase protein